MQRLDLTTAALAAGVLLGAAPVVGQRASAPSYAPTPTADHDLSVSYLANPAHADGERAAGLEIRAELRSPAPPGTSFHVFAAADRNGTPVPLGSGQLDRDGHGVASAFVRDVGSFHELGTVHFRAVVATPAGPQTSDWEVLTGTPDCEQLSFNYGVDSSELPAGLPIHDQWADANLHITAESTDPAGTDQVILFDSGNPTGGDLDLQTPGYGPNNNTALGNLLIIAEDVIDANGDGLVDDPDDDEDGGTIELAFDRDVTMCALGLIDLDKGGRGSVIRFFDAANNMLDQITLPSLGDNSFQEVQFFVPEVRRVEIFLVSSGGVPYMRLIPCPTRYDFDSNSFGVPRDFEAGERITDDLVALDVMASADNDNPMHPDELLIFDSANPSGGDTDLATPGYGPNNNTELGNVLIIAEDDIDTNGDGLVDDPDDEVAGGVMTFDFPAPVSFEGATVLDIDLNETGEFALFDAAGVLLDTIPLTPLGDNSVQTVPRSSVSGVRSIELRLSSSGALADLRVCPEPTN